ncbi:MAG: hypothetical protein KDA44_13065 [Planctomycetales bacterium]|nr:hypothetical protein [Planctomycetales bacterium]
MYAPSDRQTVSAVLLPTCKALAVALILGGLIGCSGPDADLAPVEGIVRLDGKPVASGMVTFTPAAGRSASGWIQSDGTFELGTYGDDDGALVGMHQIAVTNASKTASARPDFDNDRPQRKPPGSVIPPMYSSAEASGLTFDVKPGVDNHVELDLKTK